MFAYLLANSNLMGCSCGWQAVETIVGPAVVGTMISIIGSVLVLFSERAGGAILLAGAIIVISPILYLTATLVGFPLIILVMPNLLSGLLLLLSSLLAIPRTRHLIDKWRNEGWLP